MALCRTLQHDVVEADDDRPVGGAGRLDHFGHPVDAEVRPLGLLDLDKDPHLLAPRPIESFGNSRNPRSGKPRIKAGSGVEAANLRETEIGGKAVAVGGAVEYAIVKHDRLAFGGQHDIDLDRRRAPGLGSRECRQCVLRAVKAVAAMAAHMDPAGFACQKTKGIVVI